MPTYRSKVAITTAARRRAAYTALQEILEHILSWGIHMTRLQLMPDSFVELDTTGDIPPGQIDHLNLTGPV